MVYRSRGGDHSVENLLMLCRQHHDYLHERGIPLCDDEHGKRFYQIPTSDNGFDRWYLFADVEYELSRREQEIHDAIQKATATIDFTRYGLSVLCAEIDAMGLYSIRGYDSGVDYVVGEVGVKEGSARAALTVGHFLRANPHLLEQVQQGLYFSALRDSVPSLKQLPGERVEPVVQEMIAAQADGVPVESIVESVKEAAGRSHMVNEYEVSAKINATGGVLTLQVKARTPEGAMRAFERISGVSGPLEDILVVTERKTREI